jgi:hypothetical protein
MDREELDKKSKVISKIVKYWIIFSTIIVAVLITLTVLAVDNKPTTELKVTKKYSYDKEICADDGFMYEIKGRQSYKILDKNKMPIPCNQWNN